MLVLACSAVYSHTLLRLLWASVVFCFGFVVVVFPCRFVNDMTMNEWMCTRWLLLMFLKIANWWFAHWPQTFAWIFMFFYFWFYGLIFRIIRMGPVYPDWHSFCVVARHSISPTYMDKKSENMLLKHSMQNTQAMAGHIVNKRHLLHTQIQTYRNIGW